MPVFLLVIIFNVLFYSVGGFTYILGAHNTNKPTPTHKPTTRIESCLFSHRQSPKRRDLLKTSQLLLLFPLLSSAPSSAASLPYELGGAPKWSQTSGALEKLRMLR